MSVRWTEAAPSELDAAISHIDRRSPAGAKAVLQRIETQADLLGDFPLIGHLSDELNVRVLPVVRYPFLIFYTIDDAANDVITLHVRHTSQLPLSSAD